MQAGCTPGGLQSTQWWTERYRTGKMWTPWFIRFVFERGWYSLYTNFPNREALIVSSYDGADNFNVTQEQMNHLVKRIQPHLHLNFTKNPPIFDYHFARIDKPALLSIRPNLWHQNYFINQCHIVETNNDFEGALKGKSETFSTTTKAGQSKQTENETDSVRHSETRFPDRVTTLSLSDFFRWFLLFEVTFFFFVVAVGVFRTGLNRRRRRRLRKIFCRKGRVSFPF